MVLQTESQQYFYATGRRKSAIAKVRLYPDDGTAIIINDKPMDEYFNWLPWQSTIREAFVISGTSGRFRVQAQVTGGGVNAQAEAIRHGIARALVVSDPALKPGLRRAGFITRDARVKESKKYGLKRARREPQYTKR